MALQGVFRGRVVDASELNTRGRVRVMVPNVGGANSMPAPVAYSCNCAWGIQVGSTVVVAFEGGNADFPIVLGQID